MMDVLIQDTRLIGPDVAGCKQIPFEGNLLILLGDPPGPEEFFAVLEADCVGNDKKEKSTGHQHGQQAAPEGV
jgi:hypothetical protein